MHTVRELLAEKSQRALVCVGPDDTVFEAVTRMVRSNVGAILVMDGDRVRGILTERDYLRFVTELGRTARDTPVLELMTRKVLYTTPDTGINEVMAVMTEARIRHMPVMEGDTLVGLVSIGDCVKAASRDQEVKLRTLELYISDAYPGPGLP
ncbi:MAG: CBS domain-containing protein [bacterium]|nr:CBS domain-containing protein [bacterium]